MVSNPAPRYVIGLLFPLLYFAIRPLPALLQGRSPSLRIPNQASRKLLLVLLILFGIFQPLAMVGVKTVRALRTSTRGAETFNPFFNEFGYSDVLFFSFIGAILLTLVVLALF